jgi:tetratricopeptide (TPR) repeat protein
MMPAMRFYALAPAALSLLFLANGVLAGPASADDARPTEQLSPDMTPKQRLDTLFAALKRERDSDRANDIADQIRLQWDDSGSATINLLMQWADKAISEKRNAAAYDFLDQAIALKPDYVAAWNRRATLNFAIGDYRKSMEDINQVLRIEPRHFGSLSGMAAILGETGNDQATLAVWQRVLDIYPADKTAQEQVDKLSEKLAGSPT